MKFRYNTNFTLLNNPKDLDPSYKMDLDLWDCFGRKKTPSYNQRNTIFNENICCDPSLEPSQRHSSNGSQHTFYSSTVKILKFETPQTVAIIVLKIEKFDVTLHLMHPKDADGMTNSVDPDQTASSEAV